MTENPNRGPWIIAGAILLAAGLIVGYLVYQDRHDEACREWQALVRDVATASDLSTLQVVQVFEDVGEHPRPGGCSNP